MSSISAPTFITSQFRFSGSGKGEVDVYRFISKHSSDHHVLFLSQSSVTPRNRCVIIHEVVDGSLLEICHYQRNVPSPGNAQREELGGL